MARNALNVLVGASLNPLQKQLKKGVGLIKDFGKSAGKALAGAGGVGGAIGGILGGVSAIAGLKMAVSKFSEIEKGAVRLQSTLKAGGNTAGVTTAQVLGYANELQRTTGIMVSTTTAAAAEMGKFENIRGPNFTEAITQASNWAATIGGDVVGASTQLASALTNPREGYLELAAAGVRFSESQIDAIQSLQAAGDMAGAQGVILEALKAQYDGAAEAAGSTLSGSVDKLYGSISTLAATVGEALAPYLKEAVALMTEWVAGLDTAGAKNAIIEHTAKAVGWIVDGMQILNAMWKTGETIVGAFVSTAISGFKWIVVGIQKAVQGLEYIGVAAEGSAASIGSFIAEVEKYEAASWQTTKKSADEMNKAWAKPWESNKTDGFFAKVQADTKKTTDAMKGLGTELKKGPVDAMKQLSAEAIEAQKTATSMVKDMKLQLETFGMDDWQKQANQLGKKGATQGQVDDLKKLGAQLKGKELAQSLETPFEKFERESKKLQALADAGGIAGLDLARAKGKLIGDLQQSMPENKLQAGGAMMAGGQEARSALMSYRQQVRNADPAVALQRQNEIQTEELKQQTRYLRELAKSKPGLNSFAGL